MSGPPRQAGKTMFWQTEYVKETLVSLFPLVVSNVSNETNVIFTMLSATHYNIRKEDNHASIKGATEGCQ